MVPHECDSISSTHTVPACTLNEAVASWGYHYCYTDLVWRAIAHWDAGARCWTAPPVLDDWLEFDHRDSFDIAVEVRCTGRYALSGQEDMTSVRIYVPPRGWILYDVVFLAPPETLTEALTYIKGTIEDLCRSRINPPFFRKLPTYP